MPVSWLLARYLRKHASWRSEVTSVSMDTYHAQEHRARGRGIAAGAARRPTLSREGLAHGDAQLLKV